MGEHFSYAISSLILRDSVSSVGNSVLSDEGSDLVAVQRIAASLVTIAYVSEGELNSREPVSHVVNLSLYPRLVLPIGVVGVAVGSSLLLGASLVGFCSTERIGICLLGLGLVRELNFLTAHGAVLASTLNKLNYAKLVENVATR